MNYRIAQLLAAEDLGAAGTKTINIDIDKPISRIEMTYVTSKGSAGMLAGTPANISKIELVHGSLPLHSLTGYENQALAYYNRPGVSMDHGQHINTQSQMDTYALDFGRWLWDELLAFDPRRFPGCQLKVTYDEDASSTSDSAGTLEVFAFVFDEKEISPLGFLSAIEHYDYGCGDENSYEHIAIPDDRVIRQMLVRAYTDGQEPWSTIDEARFDEGTLDRIPWSFDNLENYYRRMKSHWPKLDTQVAIESAATARTFYFPPTDHYATINCIGLGSYQQIGISAASAKGGKFSLIMDTTANMSGVVTGYLPWHCYQFPMGKKDDIEDWYDPMGKKPRLRLRAGSQGTSGAGQVVLEELFRY